MSDHHIQQDADQGIEISLSELAAIAWRGRWIILIITALTVVLAVTSALLNANYESKGFFQFGGAIPIKEEKDQFAYLAEDNKKNNGIGIALSDYKRLAPSLLTLNRFWDYVQDRKLESALGVADLRKAFLSRDGIEKFVQPVYTFTQLDAKKLMAPTDNTNDVIGLEISATHPVPEVAQAMVAILGDYAMDSIIYAIYSDSLLFKNSELTAKLTKLDNDIIQKTEKLNEYVRKGHDLKKIIADHPGAAEMRGQQVISVTDDSVRYLSPVTQLVSTEVQISEIQESIRKVAREKQQVLWLAKYYAEAKKILESTKSGENLLRGMQTARDKVFEDKNLQDDILKEVYNSITIDNQAADNVYLENSRFVAGPTLPSNSSARPALALVGGLLGGVMFSLIFVFGRNWLQATKVNP